MKCRASGKTTKGRVRCEIFPRAREERCCVPGEIHFPYRFGFRCCVWPRFLAYSRAEDVFIQARRAVELGEDDEGKQRRRIYKRARLYGDALSRRLDRWKRHFSPSALLSGGRRPLMQYRRQCKREPSTQSTMTWRASTRGGRRGESAGKRGAEKGRRRGGGVEG